MRRVVLRARDCLLELWPELELCVAEALPWQCHLLGDSSSEVGSGVLLVPRVGGLPCSSCCCRPWRGTLS